MGQVVEEGAGHPSQEWADVLRARETKCANPAPPRSMGHAPGVPIEQPAAPTRGRAGYSYIQASEPLSKEDLFAALKTMGYDHDQLETAVRGLIAENEALKGKVVDLHARARIAEEAAANAIRELKELKAGFTSEHGDAPFAENSMGGAD